MVTVKPKQQDVNKFGYGSAQQYGSTVNYSNKNDEINRTMSVIQNRQQSGMDNSAQLSWYKKLTGQDYQAPTNNVSTPPKSSITSNLGNGLTQNNNTNQYKIQAYDPTAYTPNTNFLEKASNTLVGTSKNELFDGYVGTSHKAGSILDSNQIAELAYYYEQMDKYSKVVGNAYTNTVSQGQGITNDWYKDNQEVIDAQKNYYAIQDFISDKYHTNSTNDRTDGLSRQALGFSEHTSDWGLSQTSNPYNDLGMSNYFNDPRNQGKKFSWMDYIDPNALNITGSRDMNNIANPMIDYYYNTNFARENGYMDKGWDANGSNFDWQSYTPEGFNLTYGYGGTDWQGNTANLQSYINSYRKITGENPHIDNMANEKYDGAIKMSEVLRDAPPYALSNLNPSSLPEGTDAQIQQIISALREQDMAPRASSTPTTPTTPTPTAPIAPSTPLAPADANTYTPGLSSGVSGYTENQLIQNELFQRYLQQIYGGGFK